MSIIDRFLRRRERSEADQPEGNAGPAPDPSANTSEPTRNTMSTTEERNRFIVEKLNQGHSLGEVQKMLADELGIKQHTISVRLLAADLEVNWEKQDANKPKPLEENAVTEAPPAPRTKITVSRVVRPGAALSGDVVFASGAEAEWFVVSYGRLGINPKPGSARPSQEDLQDFQVELQKTLGSQA